MECKHEKIQTVELIILVGLTKLLQRKPKFMSPDFCT